MARTKGAKNKVKKSAAPKKVKMLRINPPQPRIIRESATLQHAVDYSQRVTEAKLIFGALLADESSQQWSPSIRKAVTDYLRL